MKDKTVARWTRVLGCQNPNNTVTAHNDVAALIDGRETFRAMYEAIQTAKRPTHYIYLLGWWLDDQFDLVDRGGTSFYDLCYAASQQGCVQIRVMLWDQLLRKNNAQIDHVNALRTGAGILDNNTLPALSHHQKVLIVKGCAGLIAFCGGVDINVDRINPVKRQPGSPMHDIHCRIQGPAAHDLVDVFVQRWMNHPKHNQLDADWGPLLGIADRLANTEPVDPKRSHYVRIGRTLNGTGKCPVKERTLRSIMLRAILSAEKFIYIEDQYLVNLEAARALAIRLKKLQHITVLIPHSSISDLPYIWRDRKRFIALLLRSDEASEKVRICYRFTPGPERFGPHSYVHSKTWIFDDELAVIGSANCNNRGWFFDSEVCAAVYDKPASILDPSFAQRLRMRLWVEHLGVSELAVADGLDSGEFWRYIPDTAKVRKYNPVEDRDKVPLYPGDPTSEGEAKGTFLKA